MNKVKKSAVPPAVVVLTLVCALLLNIAHYPDWVKYAKPDWVLLVLFYWCLALPDRVGVGWGWCSGLVLDVLYYSILGQHALAKAFVAAAAILFYRRLRLYHLWQQCVVVFIVAGMDVGITIWIYYLADKSTVHLAYWQSAFTSALLWPVVYNTLRLLRHQVTISG